MGDYFGDDLYGRYGGEEFSVMSTRQYHLFIEDINKFVAAVRNHEFTEHRLKLTCSIGICSEEQETLDQLVDIADARMYNAKRSGKDQVIEMD